MIPGRSLTPAEGTVRRVIETMRQEARRRPAGQIHVVGSASGPLIEGE
ncbi:hypothetical protein PV733_30995 [Streptomyces europaeiscabiei]|uniref:Uncharacterized protein n=1 Tax=Streptomyces europaeiscabiei TaxID=146819 RepID=A0ABU4NI98_9ACTN|nr:hypothetical protein [Streptomyces europaeiscabiei]MDX3544139.1 hypothetical protein [Streptomyces europaeiscabiei]MDX3552373.1 hypothetical protein [Streptomyces europaeiscabiei]MDX3701165.1 hypothetical protein [Streptomyces europaeiscabiei]MDX3713290.1 hypothetical protein [Streptomyces europaeiscabiei]MDX3836202.1 hypothetical protein [Streptomyces europaeiscabiei]